MRLIKDIVDHVFAKLIELVLKDPMPKVTIKAWEIGNKFFN